MNAIGTTAVERSRVRERYFIKRENVNCTSKSWYLLSKAYFISVRIVGRIVWWYTHAQSTGNQRHKPIVINVCTDPDSPGRSSPLEEKLINLIRYIGFLSLFFFVTSSNHEMRTILVITRAMLLNRYINYRRELLTKNKNASRYDTDRRKLLRLQTSESYYKQTLKKKKKYKLREANIF